MQAQVISLATRTDITNEVDPLEDYWINFENFLRNQFKLGLRRIRSVSEIMEDMRPLRLTHPEDAVARQALAAELRAVSSLSNLNNGGDAA